MYRVTTEQMATEFAEAIVSLPKVDIGDYYVFKTHHSELASLLGRSIRTATGRISALVKEGYLFHGRRGCDFFSKEPTYRGKNVVNLLYKKGGYIDNILKQPKFNPVNPITNPDMVPEKLQSFLGSCFPDQFPSYVGKFYHDPDKMFRRSKSEMQEYNDLMTKRERRIVGLNNTLSEVGFSMVEVFKTIDQATDLIIKTNSQGVLTYYTPKDIKGAYVLSKMWDIFIMDLVERDARLKKRDFQPKDVDEYYRSLPDRFFGDGRLTIYLRLYDYLTASHVSPWAFMEASAEWWFYCFNKKDASGEYIPNNCPIRMLYPNFLLSDKAKDLYLKECGYMMDHMPDLSPQYEGNKRVRREKCQMLLNNPELKMLAIGWQYFVQGESRYEEILDGLDHVGNTEDFHKVIHWFHRIAPQIEDKPELKKLIVEQIHYLYSHEGELDYPLALGSESVSFHVGRTLSQMPYWVSDTEDSYSIENTFKDFKNAIKPSLDDQVFTERMEKEVQYMCLHYYGSFEQLGDKDDLFYRRSARRFTSNATITALMTDLFVDTRSEFHLGGWHVPQSVVYQQIKDTENLIPFTQDALLDIDQIVQAEAPIIEKESMNDPLIKSLYEAQQRFNEREAKRKAREEEQRRFFNERSKQRLQEKLSAFKSSMEESQGDEDAVLEASMKFFNS